MDLGTRLKQLRKEKHKTLRDVNNDLGLSYSNLASIERGEHNCNADTLKMLAQYYGVSTDYLLCKTDNPNAQIISVADADGTLTKIEYELLDKVKGLTIEDFIEINRYIDFIKSKKGNESKWEIDF